MNFKDVDEAFAKLIIDEDHGVGRGIPRMKAADQALDIAYLKGKLRLYCRTLLYTCLTDESRVDLEETNFSAALSLLHQKEEYLAIDPALFLFTRLLRLLALPETEMSLGDLKEYLSLYDSYVDRCSLQEKIELLTIPSSYLLYQSHKGLMEFFIEGLLMQARTVFTQYYKGDGVKKHGYLNPSAFRLITINGLITISRERLLEINHVIDWPDDKTDFDVHDWLLKFSGIYSRYLDPKVRKPYRNHFKATAFFLEKEYLKAIKVLDDLYFSDNELVRLDTLRLFYYCVFSLYYHGTPVERKAIMRQKLRPQLLLDRYRKRVDYQIKIMGKTWNAWRPHVDYLARMQSIQKAYDLVYRSTPPANVRNKLEAYLVPIREVTKRNKAQIETPWMQTQIELLEEELDRQGL